MHTVMCGRLPAEKQPGTWPQRYETVCDTERFTRRGVFIRMKYPFERMRNRRPLFRRFFTHAKRRFDVGNQVQAPPYADDIV